MAADFRPLLRGLPPAFAGREGFVRALFGFLARLLIPRES